MNCLKSIRLRISAFENNLLYTGVKNKLKRGYIKGIVRVMLLIKKMKVNELVRMDNIKVLNEGANPEREITVPFCCDLLSIAMGKLPAGAAWVTVMGNVNTLAVAALADAACIILAEGIGLDELALNKAKEQGVTVLATDRPIFDTALEVQRKLLA